MCWPSGALMKTSSSGRVAQMARKVVSGTMAKLSWLCPNVLPTFSITPMTRNGMPASRHFFVERIDPGKELFHQILADDADARVVLVVGVVDVATAAPLFRGRCRHELGVIRRVDLVDQVLLVARSGLG